MYINKSQIYSQLYIFKIIVKHIRQGMWEEELRDVFFRNGKTIGELEATSAVTSRVGITSPSFQEVNGGLAVLFLISVQIEQFFQLYISKKD